MSRNSETLSRIRNLLQLATAGNSRLTAAAIGRHLEHLRLDGYDRVRVVLLLVSAPADTQQAWSAAA
jgi:hypothetical protein